MRNWKTHNLGEVIIHKKGFAFKSKDYAQIGVPIVRVSDLTEKSIDLSTCLRINEEIAKSLKEYSLSGLLKSLSSGTRVMRLGMRTSLPLALV